MGDSSLAADTAAPAPRNPAALISTTRSMIAQNQAENIIALAREVSTNNAQFADFLLQMAVKGLPQTYALTEAFCRSAEDRGDYLQANRRWTTLRRTQPRRPEVHVGYIDAMLRQRRLVEAERAAKSAIAVLGPKIALLEAQARVAEAQGGWSKAAGMWANIAKLDPAHTSAAAHQHTAEQRALDAPDMSLEPDNAVTIAPVGKDQQPELKKLLMGFESLGYNCEFGLLQRKFGADPLGFLRFSLTLGPTLIRLLTSRFAGVDDPAEMSLKEAGHEYLLRHTSSSWVMHTRIKPKPDTDTTQLLIDQCKRNGFLRGKLIKDLERQTKILVYWRSDLTDDEIDRIHAAVEAYGPNMLMCVRLFDDAHPAGSFEWRSERLLVASIDRSGNAFRGARWDISVDYWVHFCRIAKEHWDARRLAASASVGLAD